MLGPRLVIAGTRSGVGKTTVATGLMAALHRRGRRVASAKIGPDFIDPGYHTLATGRPGRNLDVWMSGPELIAPLAARAATGNQILVIEGVMGLFDGAADGAPSSTADVARLLAAPVVLVVDTASLSHSVAAIVHGYRTWDPKLHVVGVILNMVASDSHEQMLRAALQPVGIPVLGAIRRDDPVSWRSRHLGLQPVAEDPVGVRASLDRLATVIEARCDIGGLERVANEAPAMTAASVLQPKVAGRVRVAVAAGPAFSFCYPDNLEALIAAGAEVVPFDPCTDEELPEAVDAVVAGGGFPEVYAESLSANLPMLRSVRAHHDRGGVIWAECGGLLWLTRSLDGWPMAGIIDTTAVLTGHRVLGYRTATTTVESPLGRAGTGLRGHEFHYSATAPAGDALQLHGRHGPSIGGFASPRLLASYLHLHLAASPALAESIVRVAGAAPQ
jgi:cobyrinic acid a,c-diamide synthase